MFYATSNSPTQLAALRLQPRRRCGASAQPAVCAAKPKAKPAEPRKQQGGSKAAKPAKQPSGGKGEAKAAKPRVDAAPPRKEPPPAAVSVTHPPAEELAVLPALAAGPPLSTEQLLSFSCDGHVALRGLLSEAEVSALAPGFHAALDARRVDALRTGVRVALGEDALVDDFGIPFDEADELEDTLDEAGASVPFLQVFNSWRAGCASARRLACSARLVHAAAALLGVEPARVRLYQDALFVKRPGDAHTAWHADLSMTPLDCNDFLTLWVPLAAVPARADGGTALDYATASHRDVSLHYWGQDTDDLDGRFVLADHGALAAGDVSVHHGWLLHGAPPPPPSATTPRAAIAISVRRSLCVDIPPLLFGSYAPAIHSASRSTSWTARGCWMSRRRSATATTRTQRAMLGCLTWKAVSLQRIPLCRWRLRWSLVE